MSRRIVPLVLVMVAAGALFPACDSGRQPSAPRAEEPAPPPTNRVEIGPEVRRNLGMTFAQVEQRDIARTLRLPGRFELLPSAQRRYSAPAPGRVELLVEQYQAVDAGTPLYRLESPRWRELQHQLAEAQAAMIRAQAGVESIGPFQQAHEAHHRELERAVELWQQRIGALEQLQAGGGARGEDLSQARLSLAAARAAYAETLEKEADLAARQREYQADLEAARSRLAILLQSAAVLAGVPADELAGGEGGLPRWQTLQAIEVRAVAPGTVNALHSTSGAFVEDAAEIVETVRPEMVRFRARALQSDLGRLAGDLRAMIVPPQGGSLGAAPSIAGRLMLAPTADPEGRTIDVLVALEARPDGAASASWGRPGVSAFVEVVTAGPGRSVRAIPLAAVVRDGAERLIFRRDPRDPNKAIRMEADLGLDDGRWIEIKSGVADGDQVVLDGAYQLMVATSGSITKGGHFHPDGTFHEGGH